MATNDYGSAPPNAGNDAPADEEYGGQGGEKSVACMHVYQMPDGSYRVSQAEGEPVPEGAKPMRDLGAVAQVAQEYFSGADQDSDQAMADAQAGYEKGPKRPEMTAPNPGGLFGE